MQPRWKGQPTRVIEPLQPTEITSSTSKTTYLRLPTFCLPKEFMDLENTCLEHLTTARLMKPTKSVITTLIWKTEYKYSFSIDLQPISKAKTRKLMILETDKH